MEIKSSFAKLPDNDGFGGAAGGALPQKKSEELVCLDGTCRNASHKN